MSEQSSPYPREPYAWSVVGILLLCYIVSLVDRQILSLLVEPIRRDLRIDDVEFALLNGIAFSSFYGAFGIFLGRLADCWNRRNMIVIGLLVWCTATAGVSFASSFAELFFLRMLVGAGEAVLSPAAYSMIADYFEPRRRSRAAGGYSVGIYMGSGLSLLLGGAVIAATSQHPVVHLPLVGGLRGWQAVFLVIGLPGLVVAALMLLVREPARRERLGERIADVRTLGAFLGREGRLVFSLILYNSLITMTSLALLSWLPAMFIRRFGWSAAEIATAYGLVLLVPGSVGVLAGGWIADWLGAATGRDGIFLTLQGAAVGLVLCLAGLGLAPSAGLVLAAVAAATFLLAVPGALTIVALYRCTPNEFRGFIVATNLMAASLLGIGLSPVLVATLTKYLFRDEFALAPAIGVVGASCAALATCCAVYMRRLKTAG